MTKSAKHTPNHISHYESVLNPKESFQLQVSLKLSGELQNGSFMKTVLLSTTQ
ncbi:hypothetical protein ISG33_08320 [Glaciecola sp. MH2013]|uniref:hypothetical protein n=1 Tax=Glaciecola sp. MH2013 TaxID=2785524 RepID=UPI00189E366A|nr:hypothetical protein [Glaciecola sp. MH2013]MBF7073398.1 hypothetical protein [Glaciecola sp. MH2013]